MTALPNCGSTRRGPLRCGFAQRPSPEIFQLIPLGIRARRWARTTTGFLPQTLIDVKNAQPSPGWQDCARLEFPGPRGGNCYVPSKNPGGTAGGVVRSLNKSINVKLCCPFGGATHP